MAEFNPNLNYLTPTGYKFVFNRAPQLRYDLQAVVIPEIVLSATDVNTPLAKVPVAGEHIMYSPFPMTFKVDSLATNYMELLGWFQGLAPPSDFNEAITINDPKNEFNGKGRYSDGVLVVLNAENLPSFYVYFHRLTPIALSMASMDTRDKDVNYITASALFDYSYFKVLSDLSTLDDFPTFGLTS